MQQSAEVRDDASLLRLVATQRDEAAYSQLFARYERPVYSLAYMIVGNTKIAEEVVQEGMLKVWTGAGTFRVEEEGANTCVKSWIMKIIARESYLALRRR